MKKQLKKRVDALKTELQLGQQALANRDQKPAAAAELGGIKGVMQVIEGDSLRGKRSDSVVATDSAPLDKLVIGNQTIFPLWVRP